MQALIDKLNNFQLPVLCNLNQLNQLLREPEVAAADILPFIEHDPVFALYLQRLAGEKQKGRGGEIAGVEHALSMCGTDSIKQLVKQLISPVKRLSAPFQQLVAESVLAAKIAARLAILRGGNEKEAQAVALFARASEWLLYWEHPRRSWQARRMGYRRPFNHESVLETLFDLKAGDLQLAIAEQCYLPFLNHRLAQFSLGAIARPLVHAVNQFRSGHLLLEECSRELRLHIGAPEMTAVIANRLAQAICSPWLSNAWGRWLDIAAIHCHKKPNEIVKACLDACRKVSELPVEFAEFGLASGLVCERSKAPYGQFLVDRKKIKKVKRSSEDVSSNNSVTKTQAPSNETKPMVKKASYSSSQKTSLLTYCAKLKNEKDNLDLKQRVQRSLEFLVDQTPVERASFILLDKELRYCKSMLGACKNKVEAALNIKADLQQVKVWQKFTTQPAFLIFDRFKHQKYWAQIPLEISKDNRVSYFLFHSVRYGGRVRGFLYADTAFTSKRLPDEFAADFKRFVKILAGRLNQSLMQK